MRGDAIWALIADAYRDIDQLFGEGIERAGGHDLLDVLPGALEGDRVVGQHLPEIVDPVGLAGGHDVVVDGADFGGGVLIFDERESGHGDLRMKRSQVTNLR